MSLTPLAEALETILNSARLLTETETRPLQHARGCVLAEAVCSAVDVPLDDNSAMDGYAVVSADGSAERRITQRIPAGHCGIELANGTAARIFTGAPVPPGADAVVMQEDCEVDADLLRINVEPEPGQNIRPRGQDIEAGAEVFSAGARLRARDLGVLASIGSREVLVRRPLRVAVMSTGDELVEPGSAGLLSGQVYNSNRYTLSGLVSGMGLEVVDLGIVPDDPGATAAALAEAASRADCIKIGRAHV